MRTKRACVCGLALSWLTQRPTRPCGCSTTEKLGRASLHWHTVTVCLRASPLTSLSLCLRVLQNEVPTYFLQLVSVSDGITCVWGQGLPPRDTVGSRRSCALSQHWAEALAAVPPGHTSPRASQGSVTAPRFVTAASSHPAIMAHCCPEAWGWSWGLSGLRAPLQPKVLVPLSRVGL